MGDGELSDELPAKTPEKPDETKALLPPHGWPHGSTVALRTTLGEETRAIKIGLDSMARWFAVDQIQCVYAQPSTWRSKEEDARPIEDKPGCVYVAVDGQSIGQIVGCVSSMREAHHLADQFAELIWGARS